MAIRKGYWFLVGVLLWGAPIGITIPALKAFLKPGSWTEIQPFQMDIFIKNLFIFFPIFFVLGLLMGLYMFRLSQKISK